MSAVKHTPGPWVALGLLMGFGYVIKHDEGKSIAYIAAYDIDEDDPEPYGKWESEELANRALVLAAPDMLEVLIEVDRKNSAALAGMKYDDIQPPNWFVDQCQKVKDAIAKATGDAS